VSAAVSGSVIVSKTYRHPLAGGTASGLAAVRKQDYVFESELTHVFDCRVIQSDHLSQSITQAALLANGQSPFAGAFFIGTKFLDRVNNTV
jgi:hypothetical protein